MLATVILRTKYPCCAGPARVRAVVDVPRETYARTCPNCRQRWRVERRSQGVTRFSRIDVLDWERR